VKTNLALFVVASMVTYLVASRSVLSQRREDGATANLAPRISDNGNAHLSGAHDQQSTFRTAVGPPPVVIRRSESGVITMPPLSDLDKQIMKEYGSESGRSRFLLRIR
jgi:hypothetical protein